MHRRTTNADLCVWATASSLLLLLSATFSGVNCSTGIGDSSNAVDIATTSRNSSERYPGCEMSENETDLLYFLVMAPYPDPVPSLRPSWEGGPAIVPAAMVARDLINSREDILANYTIEFLIGDSGCNVSTKAINNATSRLFYCGVNVVGIIGPGCSEATLSIAPLVTDERLSLIQIAPSATSPNLTDINLYPNTFRPIVSALGFVEFYSELIEREGYTKVGALFEDRRKFQTDVYNRFEAALNEKNIKVVSYGLFETQFPLNQFRDNNTRIIFVFASIGIARQLLCIALHENFVHPDYQFIFSNRKAENFVEVVSARNGTKSYTCSENQMKQAIAGVIFADFRLTRKDRDDSNTLAQISYNEYNETYHKELDLHLASLGINESTTTEHHSNYFDATWALALALNNSLPRLEEKGLSLSSYQYGMPEVTQILRDELLEVRFEGMRGRVEFSPDTHDGADVTVIDICQTTDDGDCGIVGFYDPSTSFSKESIFQNASFIPGDFDFKPHSSLGIIVLTVVSILLIILAACQIANVMWVEHKSIKASSPNLNHLIFSGCYLSLLGAVVYTNMFIFVNITNENNTIVIPLHCTTLQWTSTMMYSLVFGTLCAKQWRISRIFNTFRATKMRYMSDNVLIAIALFPLVIDIIINLTWNTVDPWQFKLEQGASLSSCQASNGNLDVVWSLSVAIPKGVLISVVVYFAIATRRVHKKEFKQTKSINALIYSLVIMTGIFLPLFFILRDFTDALSAWAVALSYALFCAFDIGFVVLCLIFVLLPPLLPSLTEKLLKRTIKDKTVLE